MTQRARTAVPGDVDLESARCPLGCPPDDEFLFTGFDRLHELPGEFAVVRCRGCGLMRTDPRPARGSIGTYYPDDYSPHRATSCQPTPRSGWRSLVSRAIDLRAASVPPMPEGRLLEVGCGSGAFLRSMAALGWSVEGIEPTEAAAEAARRGGLPVFTGGIEQAPEPEKPYDLIVAFMVLEHLYDPVTALRRLRRWVSPKGWLVLSVPNAGSLELKLFRDAWYALQLPTHLFHFTPRTLQRVLDGGGWRVERVMHQRILSNLFASGGYWLADRRFPKSLTQKLIDLPDAPGRQHYWLYPLAMVLAALGQTGRMTVWARPRSGDPA